MSAPELSADEKAAIARFGIHDPDDEPLGLANPKSIEVGEKR